MPKPVWIREVRQEETRRLYDIDQLCFPDFMAYSWAELRFFLLHPSAVTRAADIDGDIVGFAIGRTTARSRGHVITLDVIPEARRRGIGALLMAALHEEFLRQGMTQSILEVDTLNETAQRFYASLGYERRELLPGYYQNRRDAYRMWRGL